MLKFCSCNKIIFYKSFLINLNLVSFEVTNHKSKYFSGRKYKYKLNNLWLVKEKYNFTSNNKLLLENCNHEKIS